MATTGVKDGDLRERGCTYKGVTVSAVDTALDFWRYMRLAALYSSKLVCVSLIVLKMRSGIK